jgi:hypothetical protein
LEAFEYAVESDPNYQLLKKHKKEIFRVVFKDGEEAVIRVTCVSAQYEDFVYDLLATTGDREHHRVRSDAAYCAKFADLVSASLED